ncbi:hypothetical protein N8T08_003017 [Aspergillus melleus]|uniref:Uncharacterized protein n=1 Tax=Aspergillus melleus TaxID=138277 RepID=A0ACC3B8E1_9EURO|nr:hypothetical protein N8T08_003017 [Aspergillus melleus]
MGGPRVAWPISLSTSSHSSSRIVDTVSGDSLKSTIPPTAIPPGRLRHNPQRGAASNSEININNPSAASGTSGLNDMDWSFNMFDLISQHMDTSFAFLETFPGILPLDHSEDSCPEGEFPITTGNDNDLGPDRTNPETAKPRGWVNWVNQLPLVVIKYQKTL